MTAFLEAMLRDLAGRFVVVWDGGPMHKGDPIRATGTQFADRLSLEALPPWAPMLNPVEPLWGWLKYDRLCNFAPHNAAELDGRVVAELATVEDDQAFLQELVPCLGTPASADITFLRRYTIPKQSEARSVPPMQHAGHCGQGRPQPEHNVELSYF